MRILLGTAAALLIATAALADPMAGVYGKTVTVTNAKGEATKLAIAQDSTYTATLPDGTVHKGTWAVTGDQVCFTQTEPAGSGTPQCGMVKADAKAGDTWTQGEGDAKVTVSIQ